MAYRILFLVPHMPYPPHQGGALRNFGLIKGLAERGHTVSLLAFSAPEQPAIEQTPLAALCDTVCTIPMPVRTTGQRLRDLLAGYADLTRRFWSERCDEELGRLLREKTFDVIHLDIEMAGYLPTIRRGAPRAALIYDALNAEYELQRRIALQDLRSLKRLPLAAYSAIQARRLRRVETLLCRASAHVFACSEVDADLLARLPHQTPITVVPNAITTAGYDTPPPPAALPHPALVFTGKMDYRPNVDAVLWFARSILPLVQTQQPEAHLIVVGQQPHPRLDVLRGRPDVTLTGYVSEVQPYIAGADVYVAPLRMGSGTRFKLLEAMAMGSPVVSTRLGAEGLAVEDGVHLRLADTAGEFASAVLDLLADERTRQELAANARRLVREHYDWSAIIPRVEAGYSAAYARVSLA
ncbi:MAG: glycosyltransferase [Anaerolineae bacterium]